MANGAVSVKGGTSKTKILYGPESHKLHLEFDLSPDPSAALIHQGQPCKLSKETVDSVAYDCVIPAPINCPVRDIIGISIHEQDSAYRGSIVVATKGYAVVMAKLTAGVDIGTSLKVGNGTDTYDTTSGYIWVSAMGADVPLAGTVDGGGDVTFTGGTSETGLIYGTALETGSKDDIIKVLVRN
jgi:hypothetical protein